VTGRFREDDSGRSFRVVAVQLRSVVAQLVQDLENKSANVWDEVWENDAHMLDTIP
jgi:hypothetical protein